MKVIILDGYTLNPGDLNWSSFKELGECEIYNRTEESDTIKRSLDAEIIITNKTVISRNVIENLPKLKYIGVLATGYNVVDIEAAKERNIIVTNIPAYSTMSVAQLTFSHILNLCEHVSEHSESVKKGDWEEADDFSYWNFPLIELAGQTLGIIGFGNIGSAVAKIAKSFGMEVIACSRSKKNTDLARMVSKEEIFEKTDIVSLHCPLTDETEKILNADTIQMMKKSVFIINTGRGGLVDEVALAEALNSGRIAGAGLDVLSSEPPAGNNPLLTAKNCYITPHIAWATKASRVRLMQIAAENVKAFMSGEPVNVIGT